MPDYKLMQDGYVRRLDDDTVIPPDERNGDYQGYLAWVLEGNTPQPADPPYVYVPPLLKTTVYNRMTDEELETADAFIRTQATVRQRRMWDDAVELDRNDPNLVGALTFLFGAERAAELLA